MSDQELENATTERKKAEQALHGARDPGLEASRTQSAILAYMRNELRMPISAIIGYSEMLLEDAKTLSQEDFLRDLRKIQAAGKHLLELVSDLLDPSKIEAGKVDLDLESFGANVRHALRTPLTHILGYCEMLIEDAENLGQEEFIPDLQRIHTAGRKLLALIEDIVHLSEIEAGKMGLDLESFGTSPMIRDVVTAIRPLEEDASHPSGADRGLLLVVDDNEINRDMLSRRLERQGYTVAVAENGRQALEMVKAQPFDLVLLDIMMPEMNGYQVLQHLKADPTLRHIPVIMISALDEMDSVVRCIEIGAEDYLPKPFNPVLLKARIGACLEKKQLRDQEVKYLRELQRLNQDLEVRNKFIRQTFGRYLSDELVASLLETPEGLRLGGETRKVTILMSDLRGFTSLAERLSPEQVVTLLNIYLGTMVEVIAHYQGIIDEFIGDGIMAIFGAPIQREDDAERAVACAVAMQLAMVSVNEQNRHEGLPEVAMGIGINTGEVVAGNIGSLKRTKYSLVGRQVNLASRIESYTVGGQILISEATLKEVGSLLRVNGQMTVEPKGVIEPITIYEVGGIGGAYHLFLPEKTPVLVTLQQEIPLYYLVLEEHTGRLFFEGGIVRLSTTHAEVRSPYPVAPLSNLKMRLVGQNGEDLPCHLYGKVLGKPSDSRADFCVHFTSIPPELALFFQNLMAAFP